MRIPFALTLATGFLGALLLCAGCAPTATIAQTAIRSGRVYGDFGVTGKGNTVTVENESRINKLSIIGDGNNVTVEDDVRVMKVEIWGSNNTFSLPANMRFRFTEVGTNNRFTYRPLVATPASSSRTWDMIEIQMPPNVTVTTSAPSTP